ncbi:YqxA family protein [Cytobacillus purgationiresistens]|uniref:DUF3679 domain-containing protein n=1 Tax=Cytobacillus purgationiresistens TaxID=863449 RepID=A0ABU0AE37_9BACI|nr:YqxA family protein [Cytobacillus purgationiresistens]MDQ0269514.1 hypothetical protein [Cytobacillus purgationiresistens]
MKMFMFKLSCLIALMFVSVLFGMQKANDGIHNMRGYEDPAYKSALTVGETADGELQAAILGEDVSSHDLEGKKDQLEKMQVYNFFSSLGKGLSEGTRSLTEKGINYISELIQEK